MAPEAVTPIGESPVHEQVADCTITTRRRSSGCYLATAARPDAVTSSCAPTAAAAESRAIAALLDILAYRAKGAPCADQPS